MDRVALSLHQTGGRRWRFRLGFLLFLPSVLVAGTADLIQKGDALNRQFDDRGALAVMLQADKADPHSADILYRVSREYGLSMDDTQDREQKTALGQKALEAAKQAVAADANNADAELALAISYGRLALLADNRTKIEYSVLIKKYALRASELDPKNDLAWYILGSWSYGMANLNVVLRALVRMVYGPIPEATNQEAVEYFQKALALNPAGIRNHLGLGQAYAAMGQRTLAKLQFEQALALPGIEKGDPESKQLARKSLARL